MSVEKFVPVFGDGKIKHEPKPYTQIFNKVLSECSNLEAIGLWCHFQSKPSDWIINVQYVQNHFKIGRDKAYNILRYLIKTNLMKQIQEKNPDGTFKGNYYIIKNGEEFLDIQPELSTPFPDLPDTDLPDTENPTTTNKRFNTNTSNIREVEKTPSLDDFKTEEAIRVCKQKNLDFDNELKKFKNYYEGKEVTSGKFINWLDRAKIGSGKITKKETLDDYVQRFMKDQKCSEKEAREYYRSKGYE